MGRKRGTAPSGAAVPSKCHILRLPPELLRMIFASFSSSFCAPWLASAARVCKAFQAAVEPVLYRDVELRSCAQTKLFCRALLSRSDRPVAVRRLELDVDKGASIKGPLKRAFKALLSLTHLHFSVGDPSLFALLCDVPFRLRGFVVGGEQYPPNLEAVLRRHPTIEYLRLEFTIDRFKLPLPKLKSPDILPNLRGLSVVTDDMPLMVIQHSYPVQYLSIGIAEPEDVRHALKLFGSSLITLNISRYLDESSTRPYCWATSILRKAHLPKLQHLQIIDNCDRDNDDLPPIDVKNMQVPNMHEVCPELKTFAWGAASPLLPYLYQRVKGREERLLEVFARAVFESSPTLERMGVFFHSFGLTFNGEHGDLFVRDEDKSVRSVQSAILHLEDWFGVHNGARLWFSD
ncbi:hypothetical protein BD414DRAFT_438973 [Trametes punicea]|nr:hypothetical protein BD414DRAFT_438973 [Trametes punicea]